MDESLGFFVIFFSTILLTRLLLFTRRFPASPVIRGFTIHHYIYGLVLALAGVMLKEVVVYAIGLGLVVDELGFVLIRGKTFEENYSKLSLSLLTIFIILVFIFRNFFLWWM